MSAHRSGNTHLFGRRLRSTLQAPISVEENQSTPDLEDVWRSTLSRTTLNLIWIWKTSDAPPYLNLPWFWKTFTLHLNQLLTTVPVVNATTSRTRLHQERDHPEPRPLLHPSLTPLTFPDLFGPFTETPYPLQTVTDPSIASADHHKTSPTHYVLHYIHSMADRTKQIDEGQDKWRQGVDLTSIADVNNYIKFKTLEYEYFRFMNNDLWEQYQEDFADFTEAIFKVCNPTTIRNLRTLLRD